MRSQDGSADSCAQPDRLKVIKQAADGIRRMDPGLETLLGEFRVFLDLGDGSSRSTWM